MSRKFFVYTVTLLLIALQLTAQDIAVVDFTDPSKLIANQEDSHLLNRIVELIEDTPSDEEIHVCIFKMDYEPIIAALSKAKDRGVKVQIILSKGPTSKKPNEEVAGQLEPVFKSDFSYLRNPFSEKAIFHNKFILFSETRLNGQDVSNLVVQTSSNFVSESISKVQDMVVTNNRDLYYGYQEYWYNMDVLGRNDELKSYTYFNMESDNKVFKAFFYPKRENGDVHGSDNIENILRDIDDPKTAKIDILHAKWGEDRKNILNAVADLHEKGADVNIVTNENIDKKMAEQLEDYDLTLVDKKQFSIHTKIILIDATIKGKREWVVLTGSHNLTERSLEDNFEVLLKIKSDDIYKRYIQYFDSVKAVIN